MNASAEDALAQAGVALPMQAESRRDGNEMCQRVVDRAGRTLVLAQLVQELTADTAVRRRYRRDIEQLAQIHAPGLATQLAWGPEVDDGTAPWRLRVQPDGETLDSFIRRRAPVASDETVELLIQLCDVLTPLHRAGLVVRNLSPQRVRLTVHGPMLVDVGLFGVDTLSTRTAASLVLEGSPYHAPELLKRTLVDGRADLFTLGVIAFRMLTGVLPFDGAHALLRPSGPAPRPDAIVPGLPKEIADIVTRLLDHDPGVRAATAGTLSALLRGESSSAEIAETPLPCQGCGAKMPMGQRLCLSCGNTVVRFHHITDDVPYRKRYKVVLRAAKEQADFTALLQECCAELCEGPPPALNFLLGDRRMYSKEEAKTRIRLPVALFSNLSHETATAIHGRFKDANFKVRIERMDPADHPNAGKRMTRKQRGIVAALAASAGLSIPIGVLDGGGVSSVLGASFFVGLGVMAIIAAVSFKRGNATSRRVHRAGLMALRMRPMALPASDPFVNQLASALKQVQSQDLRALIGSAVLRVQRLVDHRAQNLGAGNAIAAVTAPIAELVQLLVAHTGRCNEIDVALSQLNEGQLLRSLAKQRARGEADDNAEPILKNLDRLRDLETERSRRFAELLDACGLLQRTTELGLSVQDETTEQDRLVRAAMLSLNSETREP